MLTTVTIIPSSITTDSILAKVMLQTRFLYETSPTLLPSLNFLCEVAFPITFLDVAHVHVTFMRVDLTPLLSNASEVSG